MPGLKVFFPATLIAFSTLTFADTPPPIDLTQAKARAWCHEPRFAGVKWRVFCFKSMKESRPWITQYQYFDDRRRFTPFHQQVVCGQREALSLRRGKQLSERLFNKT